MNKLKANLRIKIFFGPRDVEIVECERLLLKFGEKEMKFVHAGFSGGLEKILFEWKAIDASWGVEILSSQMIKVSLKLYRPD